MSEIPTIELQITTITIKASYRKPSHQEEEWYKSRRWRQSKSGIWHFKRHARKTLGMKKLKRRGHVAAYHDEAGNRKGWVRPSYMHLWRVEFQPDLNVYYHEDIFNDESS